MAANEKRLKPLIEALEDHSAEGIGILTAEPWRFTQATVYAMLALALSALLWAFFGHADVLVTTQGSLVPESEVRRFYAQIDDELTNIYIAEGQPALKKACAYFKRKVIVKCIQPRLNIKRFFNDNTSRA